MRGLDVAGPVEVALSPCLLLNVMRAHSLPPTRRAEIGHSMHSAISATPGIEALNHIRNSFTGAAVRRRLDGQRFKPDSLQVFPVQKIIDLAC
jgi:hypothetical protein